MKFGICCSPTSLKSADGSASLPYLLQTLHEAGANYAECAVSTVMIDDAAFATMKSEVEAAPIRIEAFNVVLPQGHRLTGPEADLPKALEHCRKVFPRCKALGGEVIVLGSGKARMAPDDFDHARADEQLLEFCRSLGPIAQNAGIVMAIEPLNTREDNLVTTVAQGARIVDAVAHPNIQLLADLYHMVMDEEPVEEVSKAGARLKHTHLADLGRVAPGFAPEGEADFVGFFRQLRATGYDARCSFEGGFKDMSAQLKPALDLMKQRWSESA